MEKIGNIIDENPKMRANYERLVEDLMKNEEIKSFILKHKMTPQEVSRSYSNFYKYLKEIADFRAGNSNYASKGYEPILIMNYGYADISYKPTAELESRKKEASLKRRVKLVGLPRSFKNLEWADVSLDLDRVDCLMVLNDYINNFTSHSKGYYIYGDFGVGKSYMMAAMACELAKKGVATTIIHYPTFAIDIRNSIKTDGVKAMLDETKKADVLVIDDIGAEQASSWLRDEVLQVILQYRMQEDLPTFFTSNLDYSGLEKHLAETKNANEVWPAKRVMERVRYLTSELRLEGENRRY
ncbi:primosomal protein DnaI [Streptococcaceae bacterium ESL0687]|nr:primosomal protein DnaI [Streptococcaceae bacterium ESL0687]